MGTFPPEHDPLKQSPQEQRFRDEVTDDPDGIWSPAAALEAQPEERHDILDMDLTVDGQEALRRLLT